MGLPFHEKAEVESSSWPTRNSLSASVGCWNFPFRNLPVWSAPV